MNLKDYIKDKSIFFVINLLIYGIVSYVLYCFHLSASYIVIIFIVWFMPLLVWNGMDYLKKRSFFRSMVEGIDSLDQKYLLQAIIEEPAFLEGKLFYDILSTTNKAMHEEVNAYKFQQLEYRDFIESWVHEIKTPLSAAKLVLDNYGNQTLIYEELNKIEDYIEQVLYYARSSDVSNDYFVREFSLRTVVTKVIQRHAKSFIHKKIKLELWELEEGEDVIYSDPKWIEFIITQILVNAINYSKRENSKINIHVCRQANNSILTIEDNGIGIDEKDIPRVFEKGFTGENGRSYRRSTGMGLYLCKKLAQKLYIGLEIESVKHVGTKVYLIFPLGKLILLNEK